MEIFLKESIHKPTLYSRWYICGVEKQTRKLFSDDILRKSHPSVLSFPSTSYSPFQDVLQGKMLLELLQLLVSVPLLFE